MRSGQSARVDALGPRIITGARTPFSLPHRQHLTRQEERHGPSREPDGLVAVPPEGDLIARQTLDR